MNQVQYAIGTKHADGNWGMWYGPTGILACLDQTGVTTSECCIFKIWPDGREERAYVWRGDKWVDSKEPTIRERIAALDPEFVMLDPEYLDSAVVGIGSRCDLPDILVYDRSKIVQLYKEHGGMSEEEAEEYVAFNTDRSYGDGRYPILLRRIDEI